MIDFYAVTYIIIILASCVSSSFQDLCHISEVEEQVMLKRVSMSPWEREMVVDFDLGSNHYFILYSTGILIQV